MPSNIRKIIRESILPSHREIGCEGIHEELTVDSTRGNVNWTPNQPASGIGIQMPDDMVDPVQFLSDSIRRIDTGYNTDRETVGLIQRIVDTGLIEYMSDGIRNIARKLFDDGIITMYEDIGNSNKNPAHTTADIKVKGRGPVNKETGTDKIKKPEGISQQQAHGIAKIPKTGGSTNVTSVGYQDFPKSTSKSENPAGIPSASGNQKAGIVTGDGVKTQGIKVGNSLYQAEKGGGDSEYTGSKVGSVKESELRGVFGKGARAIKPSKRK